MLIYNQLGWSETRQLPYQVVSDQPNLPSRRTGSLARSDWRVERVRLLGTKCRKTKSPACALHADRSGFIGESYRNQAEGVSQALACPAHLVSIRFFTPFRTYSTGVRSVKLMRIGADAIGINLTGSRPAP